MNDEHCRSIVSAFGRTTRGQDIASVFVGDGESVFADLAQAGNAYFSSDALGDGILNGMAFWRVFVAKAVPTDVEVWAW